MLSAEIIAIGSELLTPTKTDTNSLWLTEKLNENGIEVKLKTVVGDDELRLKETIKDALNRSDVVITTGGLGPTEDDITRQVSADAVGRKLIFRENILADISKKFRKMNREMPEINKRQAFIIENADILPNPNGSAPGMFVEIDNKYLILLPGPPRELKPMFENFVLPKLKQTVGEIYVKRKVLRVTGMGESAVDELIAPIYTLYKNPQTSTLFNRSLLEELADKIVEKLGSAVFAVNGELMEEVIGQLLIENGKTLAVAESCTGGLIAQRLTEIPGASKFFIEGVIAYANAAKIRSLNVAPDLIEIFGAVSAEVAEAMAKGLLERAGTDFAISITGIAGPNGATEDKPVGLVFIGYASKAEVKSIKLNLPGDRHLIRWRASQAALDFLRRKMIKKDA